ncbi:MAG: hypothetical protein EOP53_23755 [Sphingobacteriales bacterium]|nr:MAG: hypothetical protein EOP53_23755 [Sphingobacteriales bacterium]
MKKLNHIFILFMLVSLCFPACKHEIPIPPGKTPGNTDTNNNSGNTEKPCSADSVYFENEILPMLSSNCGMAGCHGNGSAQDGVDLTNYQSIMNTADVRPGNPNGSNLYEVITEDDEDKRMPQPPKPPLSAEQIAKINKWILQGAKNNKCSSCDSTQVTFSQTVMPVISTNCKGCHNSNLASGNIELTNYEQVKTVALNGKLSGVITHSTGYTPMPQGAKKLPDCTINKIKTWIAAGAPNN